MPRKNIVALLLSAIVFCAGLPGCGPVQPARSVKETDTLPATATHAPTETSLPTATQTATPRPTNTSIPTSTSSPTPRSSPTSFVESRLQLITSQNARDVDALAEVHYKNHPYRMEFIPDGSKLVVAAGDPYRNVPPSVIECRDGRTGELVSQFSLEVPVNLVWLSSDGLRALAYDAAAESLRVYDSLTGDLITEQKIGVIGGEVTVSADGWLIGYKVNDQHIQVWNIARAARVVNISAPNGYLKISGFTPDGSLFVVQDTDNMVYDTGTGKLISTLTENSENYISHQVLQAFSPDNSFMAAAGWQRGEEAILNVWDLKSGKLLRGWIKRMSQVVLVDLIYRPDGGQLAWTMGSGNVKNVELNLLDAETVQVQRTFPGYKALVYDPSSSVLAYARENGKIELRDPARGSYLASLSGHSSQDVKEMLFSPDGKRLASRGNDSLRLWGILADGEQVERAGIGVVEKHPYVGVFTAQVPEEWFAQSSPPRYELNLETIESVVLSCPYTSNHTYNFIQMNITATVIDLNTGAKLASKTFYGEYKPPTCPRERTFSASTEEAVISQLDPADFEAWVKKTFSGLGFTQ